MADVILTKNGKRFAFPAEKAQEAMAAGFAEVPSRPQRTMGSSSTLPAAPAAPLDPQSVATRGSARGISGGPPPAGESDAPDVELEKNGKRYVFPAANVEAAKRAGFAPVDGMLARGARALSNMVTGNDRKTPETEAAPEDWTSTPELWPLQAAMNAGDKGALSQWWQSVKAGTGAALANPEEAAAVIKQNFPGVEVDKDEAGNTWVTSAIDGKRRPFRPGFRATDIPRAAGTLALGAIGGAQSNVAKAALTGAAVQTGVETSQALTGGEFNPGDVALNAAGSAAVPALVGGIKGAASLMKAGEKAAAPAATPAAQTFKLRSFYQKIVDAYDNADLDAQHLVEKAPGLKKQLDEARDYLKKAADIEAKAKPAEVVDEGTQAATRTVKLPDESTSTDTVLGRAGAGAGPTKVARRGPLAAAADNVEESSIIEPPTITPTPQAKTVAPRSRRAPEATESLPPEPTQTRTGMVQQEPTETATMPVRRPPPPTEGLEPTEVIERAPPTAASPRRRVPDDEARDIVRAAAIQHGTVDAATLSSKTGLPSSQVGRMLPGLVKSFQFRQQVAEAAGTVADDVAPKAPPLVEASMPPSNMASEVAQDWGTRPRSPLTAASSEPRAFVPPDLLDAQVARTKDARRALAASHGQLAKELKNTDPAKAVGRQRAAVEFDSNSPGAAPIDTPKGRNRSSKEFEGPSRAPTTDRPPARQWRSMFEAMDEQGQRDFVAKLLETTPPERVRDKLGLDRKAWRGFMAPTPEPAPLAAASVEPWNMPEAKRISGSIKDGRRSVRQQLRDLTPHRAFSVGEEAVYNAGGDPYVDFAGLANKSKEQSAMSAAMLDEINMELGLKGPKRVRTPRDAWAALMRKYPAETGETLVETIRSKIDSLNRAARLMRTIPGWEAFDIGAELAALEAAAKDLNHLENTGIRSLNLGDLPF